MVGKLVDDSVDLMVDSLAVDSVYWMAVQMDALMADLLVVWKALKKVATLESEMVEMKASVRVY